MARFHVWVATPAFLYLPIYALDRLGILNRVAEALTLESSEIEIAPVPGGEGDVMAIQHMLRCSQNQGGTGDIHMAIADPYATLTADPQGREARLLGAFLKRPTFWVIGRHSPSGDPPKRLICYDSRYDTATFLAKNTPGHGAVEPRYSLGEEIDQLFDDPTEQAEPGTLRVLTADVVGMELAMRRDKSIAIQKNYCHDAKFEGFLTTGVVTHERMLRMHGQRIAVFMEALRASCLLLKTAPEPTATLIHRLSREKEFEGELTISKAKGPGKAGLDVPESKAVAKRIFDDGIFSNSLIINPPEWKSGLKTRREEVARDVKNPRHYFFKVYRRRPATQFMEAWIKSALNDYDFLARSAELWRVALLIVAGTLVVAQIVFLLIGLPIIEQKLSHQIPNFQVWRGVGWTAFLIGLYWAAKPWLQMLFARLGIDHLYRTAHAEEVRREVWRNLATVIGFVATFALTTAGGVTGMSTQELLVSLGGVVAFATVTVALSWKDRA